MCAWGTLWKLLQTLDTRSRFHEPIIELHLRRTNYHSRSFAQVDKAFATQCCALSKSETVCLPITSRWTFLTTQFSAKLQLDLGVLRYNTH